MNPVSSRQVSKYTSRTHFTLAITVLGGNNLPKAHRITSPAYYVIVKVDDTEMKTTVSTKGNKSPTWKQLFKFAATSSSTLRIEVYCTHLDSSKKDHIVCKSRETLRIGESLSRNEDVICALDVVHPRSSREKDRTITLRLKVDSLTIPSSTGAVLSPNNALTKEAPTPGPEYQKICARWKYLLTSLESFWLVAKDIAVIDSKAQVAVAAVSVVLKLITDQIDRDEKIDDLASTLADLYDWLQDGRSLKKIRTFEKTVIKLLKQTSECAYFIRKYYETYSFMRRAIDNIGSEVDATITQYQSVFDQLKVELILGTSLQTTLLSIRILEKVTNIEIQMYLNRFPCLERTAFDPEYAAMRGTHFDTSIDHVLKWVVGAGEDENTAKRVFLLLGPAGSGKSAIAHFVAQHFYEEGRLGCGIFLYSGIENRNSQRISGTIIRQLAQFHPAIKQRMNGPISNPDVALADIGRQFDELVATPLDNLEMVGPVLIIIDGLDECGDAKDRSRIMSIFADKFLMTRLPRNFRFLITSCLEQDVQDIFKPLNHVCYHTMPNPNNESSIQATFDVVRLPALQRYGIDRMKREFLRKAGGDVVWTSVACRALQLTSTQTRLNGFADILLIKPPPATLKDSMVQLYDSIFQALNSNRSAPPYIVHFRTVLLFGTDHVFSLVVIDHEQNSEDIANISQISSGLGIVMIPTIISTNAGLRDVLADFLTNERHCIDHIPYVEQSLCDIAEACLDRMNESLRHNICGLSTTSDLDIEINGLTKLVEEHIPKDLQYAVANWMTHVLEITHLTETLMKKLHELLFEHLLHWIEVLSVIGCLNEDKVCASLRLLGERIFVSVVGNTLPVLMTYALRHTFQIQDEDGSCSKLCKMIKNAISFLRSYNSTICRAHLQTYISALPLFPSNTLLHRTYIREVIAERPRVSSNITFNSPHRGFQLVNCKDDKMVCIFDVTAGEDYKMKGHSRCILCTAFSPDGQRFARCGRDETIRVWDVQTSRQLNKLTGHDKPAKWVEFSQDGSMLVSRSADNIITWNSDTGDVIAKRDISGWPYATFSPDGQQVATTSDDKIKIFDFKLIHQIAVLDRHKEHIQQIAWSLDGSKLASSSSTETLLWDAKQMSVIAVLDAKAIYILSLRFITTNQLSLVADNGVILVHKWDINTPKYNQVIDPMPFQNIRRSSVPLCVRQVVARTKSGDIRMSVMFHHTPAYTPTVRFHEPFNPLRLAHHVNPDGWLCAQDGQKIVWVAKCEPPFTVRRSIGKLEFLDHKGRIRLVMESSSIE